VCVCVWCVYVRVGAEVGKVRQVGVGKVGEVEVGDVGEAGVGQVGEVYIWHLHVGYVEVGSVCACAWRESVCIFRDRCACCNRWIIRCIGCNRGLL
jgi:hypothetical protein